MTTETRTRAYLYDLYLAPLWRDRFDQLFLDHVPLPTEGRVLLVECGTGGLALELANHLKDSGSVTASDRDAEYLDLAQAKSTTVKLENLHFISDQQLHQELTPNAYDFVVGDASLLPAAEFEPLARMLFNTISPEGKVVLYTIIRGSFDEFFSVYWEALYECGLAEHLNAQLETLLYGHPTLVEVEDQSRLAGLRNVQIFTAKEEFSFHSGEEFLSSPVIAEYRLEPWFQILPQPTDRKRVKEAICAIIDRDRNGQTFEISIKTAVVIGNRQPEGSGRIKTKTEKAKP
ncbi:MAG: methyltransferase domain-containing protein [Blastocatellia bacterium]|nr:methyltransferase domain-containing protein [Blastocatellia bacterium]